MAKFINMDSKWQFPRVGVMGGEWEAPIQWVFTSVSHDEVSERQMIIIVVEP